MYFVIVFILFYLFEPRRYSNIFLLAIVLLALFLKSIGFVFFNTNFTEDFLYVMSSSFVFAIIPLSILFLALYSFFNSKELIQLEGRRLSNFFLGLIGVLFLLFFVYYLYSVRTIKQSLYLELLFFYLFGLFQYFMLLLTATAIYSVLYNIRPIMYEPSYIIVLGSGLLGDEVPPLLASRIEKAVEQYHQYGKKPLLLMSGGKGSDEKVSEAVAMKKYIHDHYPDILDSQVVVEDQSTTTLENMIFSKRIVDERFESKEKGIFVTNQFHLLRAGIYARIAHLDAQGVGSKTAFYYVPNAFVREFIGLLEMNKGIHILLLLLYTGFFLLYLRIL